MYGEICRKKIIVLLYLQFVYQMVSQVLRDILMPAFPNTCGSGGAYRGHGSNPPRIIHQTGKSGRASVNPNSYSNSQIFLPTMNHKSENKTDLPFQGQYKNMFGGSEQLPSTPQALKTNKKKSLHCLKLIDVESSWVHIPFGVNWRNVHSLYSNILVITVRLKFHF